MYSYTYWEKLAVKHLRCIQHLQAAEPGIKFALFQGEQISVDIYRQFYRGL